MIMPSFVHEFHTFHFHPADAVPNDDSMKLTNWKHLHYRKNLKRRSHPLTDDTVAFRKETKSSGIAECRSLMKRGV